MPGLFRDDLPEVAISEQRMQAVLVDIKRNSRNRRIAMVAPLALAAAVLAAMIAAPPRHGGLLVADADAEAADPQLPRVFGANGVWQLAVPIDDEPIVEPAAVIEAPVEPASPSFTLSPPDQEELQSLPASTSTPPMSTSGQTPDEPVDPADLDWSQFEAVIRVEAVETAEAPAETAEAAETVETAEAADVAEVQQASEADDALQVATTVEPAEAVLSADSGEVLPESSSPESSSPESSSPESSSPESQPVAEDSAAPDSDDAAVPAAASEELDDTDSSSLDGDVTVAAPDDTVVIAPQDETGPAEANPSTPLAESTETETLAFNAPATIVAESVLVYSAHVSVTVQVADNDSSVVDWCNTRVDWGDGSVSRVAGVDESAVCTASCEHDAGLSAAGSSESDGAAQDSYAEQSVDAGQSGAVQGIAETMQFEHDYLEVIDASPRVFVATGDGCTYTLAELQLPTFTVVPLG